MSRSACLALLALMPLAAPAQEQPRPPRSGFVHVGAAKLDPGAGSFTPVLEAGYPVLQWGLTSLGVFAGGAQWRRGRFGPDQAGPGALLDKTALWAGAYTSGAFWSFGLAAEYATQQVYVTPSPANNYFNGVDQSRSGLGLFLGLHGQSGFGAFVRLGSQSGFGCGLSFHF